MLYGVSVFRIDFFIHVHVPKTKRESDIRHERKAAALRAANRRAATADVTNIVEAAVVETYREEFRMEMAHNVPLCTRLEMSVGSWIITEMVCPCLSVSVIDVVLGW